MASVGFSIMTSGVAAAGAHAARAKDRVSSTNSIFLNMSFSFFEFP
jgi:hypothetical protein